MPSRPRLSREQMSLDSGDLVANSLCDRFERQWRLGQRPELEAILRKPRRSFAAR